MHHSARARKQKTLKILCFVIWVEDYHKLTQTKFLIQSSLGNLMLIVLTKTTPLLAKLPMDLYYLITKILISTSLDKNFTTA